MACVKSAIQDLKVLWGMVLEPPRQTYDMDDLPPTSTYFAISDGRQFKHHALQLTSSRGYTLECSHFYPKASAKGHHQTRCVVYLHGMGSNRTEVTSVLDLLLARENISVFCFDFAGCGFSGGKYISFGHNEQLDVKDVIDYLRNSNLVSSIALWGRSMGAATAIFRVAEDPEISACVLDSAFSDLPQVVCELVNRGQIRLPNIIIKWTLRLLRRPVQKFAGFDFLKILPVKKVSRAVVPVYFVCAEEDTVVLPHHSRTLHDTWGSRTSGHVTKRLVSTFGEHNDLRPDWITNDAIDFLESHFPRTLGHEPSRAEVQASTCHLVPRAQGEMNHQQYLRETGNGEGIGSGEETAPWCQSSGSTAEKVLQQSTLSFKSLGRLVNPCTAKSEDQEHEAWLLGDSADIQHQLRALGLCPKAVEAGKHCSTVEEALDLLEGKGNW